MPENPAIAYIDALKAKLACSSDEQLSRRLGLGKSTLASWRLRASVPKRVRDYVLVEYGIDYDRIVQNDDGREKVIRDQIQTAFYISILRIGRYLTEGDLVEVASWIAGNEHLIRNFFMGDFEKEFGKIYNNPEEFTQMLMRVARGEQGGPEAILSFKRQQQEGASEHGEFPT
ncbi:MAG: hypothetical protein PGN25_22215 [Methylorubrum populi]